MATAESWRPWECFGAGNSALYQGDTTGGSVAGARGRAAAAPFHPKLDTLAELLALLRHSESGGRLGLGVSEQDPGFLVRLQRGNNAPSSCKTQLFKVTGPKLKGTNVPAEYFHYYNRVDQRNISGPRRGRCSPPARTPTRRWR